jgi:diketogulonate reductase-like aldo/keto reductase
MTITTIPAVGFGTGNLRPYYEGKNDEPIDEAYVDNIVQAIQAGFTHIDTAEVYGTEKTVARAIQKSGVPREKLFIITKIFPDLEDPEKALRASLKRLGVDYVDQYLIHTPFFEKLGVKNTRKSAWQTLEKLHDQGLAKSIGVSNFQVQHLNEILSFARIRPAINQIEYNPNLPQTELINYLKKHDIGFSVYGALAPLISGEHTALVDIVKEIADRHRKTPSQVLIKWSLQKGAKSIITSSRNESRIKELLNSSDFTLDESEVERISAEGQGSHVRKYWPAALFEN